MRSLIFCLLLIVSHLGFSQIPLLDNKKEINEFLDNWHQAAADADAEKYFGAIATSGVYLGPDPSERWSKDQFIEYTKESFENG
ncbi:MAG: nuclear transport factor 2 family protein, partial [Bacteroidota bacterium]